MLVPRISPIAVRDSAMSSHAGLRITMHPGNTRSSADPDVVPGTDNPVRRGVEAAALATSQPSITAAMRASVKSWPVTLRETGALTRMFPADSEYLGDQGAVVIMLAREPAFRGTPVSQ